MERGAYDARRDHASPEVVSLPFVQGVLLGQDRDRATSGPKQPASSSRFRATPTGCAPIRWGSTSTQFLGHGGSRVAYLTSRIVRDRIFRRIVLRAYDARCAVTSLKLINGSGRAEVEAAHIRPVEANGPDIVSNGLALSGTAHWMFDRGLISIADDHEILISRHVNDTAGVRAITNKTGRIQTPARTVDHPHPHFLRWHLENRFKA